MPASESKEQYAEIATSIADIIYGDRLISECEELGALRHLDRNFSSIIGETPIIATMESHHLIGMIEAANNGKSITSLYAEALLADNLEDSSETRAEFGQLVALQAMGHGRSWFDDHAEFPLELPFAYENSLEIGKADFMSIDGFDPDYLEEDQLKNYNEFPDHSEPTDIYRIEIAVGYAKGAILEANKDNDDAKKVKIETLASRILKNPEAMAIGLRALGAFEETNQRTVYQLTPSKTGSEILDDSFSVPKESFAKKSWNPNNIQLGQMIHDWSIKGKEFHELVGFSKEGMPSASENLIKPVKATQDRGPSPSV